MDKMGHNFWGRNLNVKCPTHLKNDTTFVKNVKNFQNDYAKTSKYPIFTALLHQINSLPLSVLHETKLKIAW